MNAPELAIIMPVYNEQAFVRKVVTEWFHKIENYNAVF
jgi:glycosyltransferase involved in cell wall biosynthesis